VRLPKPVVSAVIVAMAACATAGRLPRPHALVIVTLDTTRADRLPVYGYASVSTPALDRLAREGVVFDAASSVAPLTLTAHTSLFTGLYPPHHRVQDNAAPPLDARRPTIATILHAYGFRTAAFVGSTVLAADRGLARGFDVYNDGCAPGVEPPRRRPGDQVMDAALAWLDTVGWSPFLLWVHLYDAHAPQTLPIMYRREYGDAYEGGIAFADAQLQRLVDSLDRKRLLDMTAVIVAGDHGESLGDHGEIEHGIFLYESTLHVPLVVRSPGLAPGRVSSVASLADVLPTVLDLFGLPATQVDGASLKPALDGRRDLSPRGVYAESMYPLRFGWSPLRAFRDERFKYIDAPRPELYDLEADPFEEHDLSRERPAVMAALRRQLDAVVAGPPDATDDGARVSPEVQARLAALGYTSGVVAADPASSGRDPKDFIQIYNVARQRARR